MKQIRIILATALASIAALQGCKKADTTNGLVPQAAAATSERRAMPQATTINYRLIPSDMGSGNPLIWTSGYLNNSTLSFDGVYAPGDAPGTTEVTYDADVNKLLNLQGYTDLATMKVPAGYYTAVKFRLLLNQSSTAHAAVFSGIYYSNNNKLAVNFVIDQQLTLSAAAENVPLLKEQNACMLAVDMKLLGANIDRALFDNAAVTNGTITISNKDNVVLYNLMLRNLYSMMSMKLTEATVINPQHAAPATL